MIDLRSDTVTKPSRAMLSALADAEVGDDVYSEDPTVNRLEARTAELLGHEAGLFVVSGTMSNLLGVWLSAGRGEEVLCDEQAHIARAELGSHASLNGIQFRTWSSGGTGLADPATIEALIAAPEHFMVRTAGVEIENTHNFGGGTVQPIESLRAISALCAHAGLRRHLDGARLWNAHIATGVPLDEYGKLFDTVTVCFSKGLGAPVGSVLVGSADDIARARMRRKEFGGGWRQAGVLAQAALWALDHNLERLADDHANAVVLADAVTHVVPEAVPTPPQTNIVVFHTGARVADDVVASAQKSGVRISAVGAHTVRAVTHLDVTSDECAQAGHVLGRILTGMRFDHPDGAVKAPNTAWRNRSHDRWR